jgi:pimeloyl-ACP methyl ester carboxylesterase
VRIPCTPRNWSWRRRSSGLLAVLVSVCLLGALSSAPAQAQTRRPLLLIGGTFATATGLDVVAKPWFVNNGYDSRSVYTMQLATDDTLEWWVEGLIDAFAATLGFPPEHVSAAGTASIDHDENDPSSGEDIRETVDRILAEHPSADKVDIIGHSQGATAARWYVKDSLGRGEDNVHTLISLGGAERGVLTSGLADHALWWYACREATEIGHADVCDDMIVRSGPTRFLRELNHTGDPTPGNVRYYHLYVPDDGLDSFADLGFESELIPDPDAKHEEEWEHPVLRERMLARLRS